jgi:hypothetical protein
MIKNFLSGHYNAYQKPAFYQLYYFGIGRMRGNHTGADTAGKANYQAAQASARQIATASRTTAAQYAADI